MANKQKEVRSIYRLVEDILYNNLYDIYGKMMTHNSKNGFSLYVRAKRICNTIEDAILIRVSDHPAVDKYGRSKPDFIILVDNANALKIFENSLLARIDFEIPEANNFVAIDTNLF